MEAKRRRLAGLVGLKNVTTEALAAITKKVHEQGSEEFSTWTINNFIKTEFAKVRFNIHLPIGEAEPFAWTLCRPDLLISYFAAQAEPFRRVMGMAIRSAGARPLSAVLYLDEVTPGNIIRPDNQRRFWSFYLGFTECAAEHLCREEFWLPLAMLRTTIAAKVDGGMSCCIKLLLRKILMAPCNLASVGVTVVIESPVLLRAALTNLLADESALKSVWRFKGAAGLRACGLCRNVMSLRSELVDGQTYLVDVSCSDSSKFVLCTNEDVWEAHDRLEAAVGHMTKGDFDRFEKASGINYSSEGLLADKELRTMIGPASVTTMDWMHNFLVHGIANLEVFGFLRQCRLLLGIKFEQINTYVTADWCWPKSQSRHKINEVFTAARERASSEAFKASASELMMAYPLLRKFAQDVVAPTRIGKPRVRLDLHPPPFYAQGAPHKGFLYKAPL